MVWTNILQHILQLNKYSKNRTLDKVINRQLKFSEISFLENGDNKRK